MPGVASRPRRAPGVVDRAEVVGDHAAVRARRDVPQLRGAEGAQRRLQAEGQQLERDGRPEVVHRLVRGGDDDEAVGRGGDDLLPRVRGAAALDEPAVGGDLVGAVDREVEPVEGVEGLDREADRARPLLGLHGRGHAADVELARGQRLEQEGDCRAGAEADAHPVSRRGRPRPRPPAASRAERRSLARYCTAVSWADWVRGPEVEPSIYAADFARLGVQLEALLDAGVRIFHVDVGDGHFIGEITFGPVVLRSISGLVHERGAKLDCHLMVAEPERQFEKVKAAGGDSVTFHVEAVDDPSRAIAARPRARPRRRRLLQPRDRGRASPRGRRRARTWRCA